MICGFMLYSIGKNSQLINAINAFWDQIVCEINITYNSTDDKNSLCQSHLQRVCTSGVEQSTFNCSVVQLF